jgi:hypothetical protein
MSGYFVKKPFPMHFTYIYTVLIYNCSYGWDALQKHSVKTKVDKGLNDVPFP